MKKRENKEEKENEKSDEPGKCEEEESEVSTDKEERKEEGGNEEGASLDSPQQPPDSPTFKPPNSPTLQPPDFPTDIDASIQKTNLNSFQVGVETQMGEESKSAQEKEEGLQMGDTGQMTEYYLKEEEMRKRTGKEEEEEGKKIPTSKANKLWKWWRKMWTTPMDIQSNDVKHKAPDKGNGRDRCYYTERQGSSSRRVEEASRT